MILTLDKKQFLKQFLEPISKITEECSIIFTNNTISSLVNDDGGNIILSITIENNTGIGDKNNVKLNFKDIRKFIKIINIIPEDVFELVVNENSSVIKYTSPSFKFRLHLVLDNIIKRCTINIDKINKLTFDSNFVLKSEKIKDILKSFSVGMISEKVYFYTKDGKVYAELTDKSKDDMDSITFNISDSFKGDPVTTPLPFDVETFRLINNNINDMITVKINNLYKIILFEISPENRNDSYKYIVPTFTK